MTVPVPLAFPEEQARLVADWATRLGVQAAVDLIQQIRMWLGRPEKVVGATRQWSPLATGHIVASGEGLTEVNANVADYWEGRGQAAFDKYVSHMQGVIRDTRLPIERVAATLTDSLDIIRDAYKEGTQFIADCAIAILRALEGVPGIVEGLITRNPVIFLKGASDAIVKALQGFVTAANNLAKATMDILTEKTQTGLKLESAVSIVPLPDNAPASLGDRDRWKVRPNDA
jgi:hypothetical protein